MQRGLRVKGIIHGRGRPVVVRAHPSDPWAARLDQLAHSAGPHARIPEDEQKSGEQPERGAKSA